jgi:hypothetical protein
VEPLVLELADGRRPRWDGPGARPVREAVAAEAVDFFRRELS